MDVRRTNPVVLESPYNERLRREFSLGGGPQRGGGSLLLWGARAPPNGPFRKTVVRSLRGGSARRRACPLPGSEAICARNSGLRRQVEAAWLAPPARSRQPRRSAARRDAQAQHRKSGSRTPRYPRWWSPHSRTARSPCGKLPGDSQSVRVLALAGVTEAHASDMQGPPEAGFYQLNTQRFAVEGDTP